MNQTGLLRSGIINTFYLKLKQKNVQNGIFLRKDESKARNLKLLGSFKQKKNLFRLIQNFTHVSICTYNIFEEKVAFLAKYTNLYSLIVNKK